MVAYGQGTFCFPTSWGACIFFWLVEVWPLADPWRSLVWPPSDHVRKGSCTGQCLENFFKTERKKCWPARNFFMTHCCPEPSGHSVDTSASVNMYIGIGGKMKGAWHLNYLVKHPLAPLGFYIFQLFFFHLSLIIPCVTSGSFSTE